MAERQDLDLAFVCQQAARKLGYDELKSQQLKALMEFVRGQDVFVVLPTGYGKSLIYACMPCVFDTLHGTHNSMVVVVTPLTAIMKDQVHMIAWLKNIVSKCLFWQFL